MSPAFLFLWALPFGRRAAGITALPAAVSGRRLQSGRGVNFLPPATCNRPKADCRVARNAEGAAALGMAAWLV
jgi:hypothetical protein